MTPTDGDVGPVDALLTGFLRDGHGGEYAAVVRGRGEGHGAGERREGREREDALPQNIGGSGG